MIVSFMGSLALGLTLVWLNLERTRLAYDIRNMQREVSIRADLGAQRQAEREYLLSPHVLGAKAEELGLFTAKPGQVRRMGLAPDFDETVSPLQSAGAVSSGLRVAPH
jgi:hypothetical protein